MAYHHTLSRREFLRLVGLTASAAMLEACASQISTMVVPTATAIPLVNEATPTPIKVDPTATASPVREATPTATATPPVIEATPTAEPAGATIEPATPEMVLVEAGSFKMGSTKGLEDEQPVHTVKITRPFHVARYAVTFEEYDRFRRDKAQDGGWGRGKRPVMGVNWNDALAYCNWLSKKQGLTPYYSGGGKTIQCVFSANGYRLPTEAEWEYAARGGQKSKGYLYAGSDNPDDVAWHAGNSGDQTHPVGQKLPNELGLYDMSGNLWEWCWDWYGSDYYASSPVNDPTGPPSGSDKVRRSGSWREAANYVRTTFRSAGSPSYPGANGFRLVRTA